MDYVSSCRVIGQVEAGSVSGVRRRAIRDACPLIKAKRCEVRRSSSCLPNLLSLMKAFVSEREEEL